MPKGIVDILCSFSASDQNVWVIIDDIDFRGDFSVDFQRIIGS